MEWLMFWFGSNLDLGTCQEVVHAIVRQRITSCLCILVELQIVKLATDVHGVGGVAQ
jgi:hypothetical protein